MTGRRVSDRRGAFLPYLALVTLALIWGVSFLFIKVAVQDMGPAALVLIRSFSGCLALGLIVRAMGRPLLADGGIPPVSARMAKGTIRSNLEAVAKLLGTP